MLNLRDGSRGASRRRAWGLVAGIGLAVLMVGTGPGTRAASPLNGAAQSSTVDVDQSVRDTLASGANPDVIVRFRGRADLSAAFAIADRDTRATYVYSALTNLAAQKQASVLQLLQSQFNRSANRAGYSVLWIDNSIAVPRITEALLDTLTASADVESVHLDNTIELPQEPTEAAPWVPHLAVSSLVHIKVPDVWALGYRGAGVVVANIDAGVRYTHEALVGKYRGNHGDGSFDHEHNWYDPYQHSSEPRTTSAHGSHTMGTMVGDGGGDNQIGAAPDAKWFTCLGFGGDNGGGSVSGLMECGQWVLAPYATDGSGTPDPTAHADIVNNSWGDCTFSFDNYYESIVDSWIAAGMVPVFSNGNASNCNLQDNPALGTVGNPARYGKVLGIGSTGTNNSQYAPHSLKGPTDNPNPGLPNHPDPAGFADLKPNLVAPGVDIYSASDAGDAQYLLESGTSMSAPAISGVIALMWSAAPCLHGNYGISGSLLMHSATAIPYASGSPSDGPGNVPNQATGWGEVDALAAVNAAIAYCQSGGTYPPTVNKTFDPAIIVRGTDSVLTIRLANATATDATLTAALTDALPAGVVISATPAASTTCPSGTVQATAGGTSVGVNAGTKIPADDSCEIKVNVTSANNGNYANTIPVGALQTDLGNNVTAGNATLHVSENGMEFPLPYCSVYFGRGVEPITHVVIGGIDNRSSPAIAGATGMEDFTGIYGNLRIGSSVPITIEGNTNGNYTDYVSVFFDWGHDGFFSSGEESLAIGTISNSSGTDGVQLTGTIFVPLWATPGNTRMRVIKRFEGYVDLGCSTDTGFGQSEDYSITLSAGENLAAPSVATSYAPPIIPLGGSSVVTVELINPNAEAIALSADLVDTLPAGLVAGSASTTCRNAQASASANSITLAASPSDPTDIASIPANGSCTLSATVQAGATGSYVNTIAAGALQTNAGNNAVAATATLTVNDQTTNGIILAGPLDRALTATTVGTSLNIVTSTFDDSGALENADFDFYTLNGQLTLLRLDTYDGTYAVDSNGKAKLLLPGDVIGPAQTFANGWKTVEMSAGWPAGTDGYLGVRFNCDGRLANAVASTVCYGYVHITTVGPLGYPAIVVDTGFDGDGRAITVPGRPLNAPSAALSPATLSFTVAADYSATQILHIANASGSKPLNYLIASRNPAKWSIPLAPSGANSGRGSTGGVTVAQVTSPWAPAGSLLFQLDDGSTELAFGSDVSEVYINRFTPPDGTGAFTVDSISILWPSSDIGGGDLTGKQVNLLVYYDADGDGNPANAARVGDDMLVTVSTPGALESYPVTLAIPGAGDVYIGFQDIYKVAGDSSTLNAAGLDQTSPSADRSYLATNVVEEPDINNLGNNFQLGTLSALSSGSFDGNWTIRATGTGGGAGGPCTGAVLDWLTTSPSGGVVSGGRNADVSVTVNPGAANLAAGAYSAELCLTTNEPSQMPLVVPVSVTVTAATCSGADTLFCNGFDPDRVFPQAVQDPSFEATQGDAGLNPSWQASVTTSDPNNPPPASPFYINNVPSHTGNGTVWAGGFGVSSTAAWWQSVVIHRGGPRYLNYWRFIQDAPGAGELDVSVDNVAVSMIDLAAVGADHGWTAQSIDISAFADDAQHTIRFDFVAATNVDGNVFVDDVTIDPSPIAPLGAKPH